MTRRARIPGATPDGERAINAELLDLQNRLRALELRAGRPGVIESDTAAKVGEFLNIEAPADGLTVILPQPVPALRNARVTLNFRNSNPVRITSILGKVNRANFATSSQVGTFDAVCDGLDGWSVQLGLTEEGPSGGALDAEYIVGAAHGSLPSARVATDSTEVYVDLTVANVASWVLRTASVAFEKLANLTGLSVLGRAAASSGVMAAITATAARQTLRVNDAGTQLEWGHPLAALEAGADQGDVYALDFESDDALTLSVSVASGVATITPSVDLSSVTYSAGDGLDLASNVFSVDVSDFAGSGLEDDGSNNLRIAAAAAGAGLTGGGGSALAVGAGTGITVSANDVAWSGFSSDENSSGGSGQAFGWRGLDFIDNTFISWSNSAPGDAFLGVSLELDDDALATQFAGAGLTASGGVMAVGAGTGITVNANSVQLSTISARSVLANATNATAVPTALQGTTARHVLRVNDAGNGLEFGNATLTIEDNNVAEGSAHTLDFQSGDGVDIGVLVSAGQAIVTPSLAFDPTATAGGLLHFFYSFDVITTMSDPGSGDVRFNSSTPSSVTQFVIDDFDNNGIDVGSSGFQSPFSWGRLINAYVTFRSRDNPFRFATYRTTTGNDQSGYWDATCVHIDSNGGNFTNGEQIDVFITPNGNNLVPVPMALDADMEAGSSFALAVPPGRVHRHPSAAKFWACVSVSGGTPALDASYNVTSVTDTNVGRLTVNIATDFSGADYAVVATSLGATSDNAGGVCNINAQAAGSVEIGNRGVDPAEAAPVPFDLGDPAGYRVVGFGDHS